MSWTTVLLPHPLGPTSATVCPFFTCRSIPCRTYNRTNKYASSLQHTQGSQ